ncbi:hypothetical protein K440DRAFT_636480 [Wilcoxina mikolae CBS 423.85]|nr:hypothetical protein K440DRAFT_636480 [Wilcoxina mikolae CBS 423.85]
MPSKSRGRKRAAVLAVLNRILTNGGDSSSSVTRVHAMAMQQAATSLHPINCGDSSSPQDTLAMHSAENGPTLQPFMMEIEPTLEMIVEGDGRTPKSFSMGSGPTLATLPMDVLFIIFKCFDDYDSPRSLAQSCRSLPEILLETDVLDPAKPAVDGLELVNAVLRDASIIKKTAAAIFIDLNSSETANFVASGGFRIEPPPSSEIMVQLNNPQSTRAGWDRYARDVIRETLYRAWILLMSDLRLQRKVVDFLCPMSPDQMTYFAEGRWREWGYPDLTPILPAFKMSRTDAWVVMMDLAYVCRECDQLNAFARAGSGMWETEKRDEESTDQTSRRSFHFRSTVGGYRAYYRNDV